MYFLIEALNFAGSLGAIVSWPPLLVVAILYLVFQARGREMTKPVRIFVYIALCVGTLGYMADLADRFGWTAAARNMLPLTKVYDRTFANERVILDGFS